MTHRKNCMVSFNIYLQKSGGICIGMDFKDVGNCEKNIKLDQAKCIDKQIFCV